MPKALQARRARRGQLVQEGRLELLVLEELQDSQEQLVREARQGHKAIQGHR